MKRYFSILIGILCVLGSMSAETIYTDEMLFSDYLRRDLRSWGAFIDASDWDGADVNERLRIINYEYGYIATAIDSVPDKAPAYLAAFKRHIEALHGTISESTYCTYSSAAAAYDYMLDKSKLFSAGLRSFNLCKDAVEHDPDDPIALTLKGNVDFYAPRGLGGSKKRALEEFLHAEKMFHQRGGYRYLWNYWSMQMCIAQCYEKTDRLDEAIARCRMILKENPDFLYIKEEYLPALLRKKNGKK